MKRLLRQIYDDLSNGRLSQKEALEKIKALKLQERSTRTGILLAMPVWQAGDADGFANPRHLEFTERHVLLGELPRVDARQLVSSCALRACAPLETRQPNDIARLYSDYALACFEQIQAILRRRPQGKVLVQVVVSGHREQAILAGLSGMLQTAALENPSFFGQFVLVAPDVGTEELSAYLLHEQTRWTDRLIRYEQGKRQVLRWQEIPADTAQTPVALGSHGLYLITGGVGGLGILFAKEILEKTEAGVVLTGRSALNAETRALIGELTTESGRVSYRQVDVGDLEQVVQLVASIKQEHGQLTGILHCAGVLADDFILKKDTADFAAVLAPKVTGTFNLDYATRDIELDLFVLFSSVAGALGNVGQSDYAAANGFMDQFAAYRNRQVEAGERYGRTRSIDWPLWQAGGMKLDPMSQERLQQATGIRPMQTAKGMSAFYRSLALPYDQVLVAEGDLGQMRLALFSGRPIEPETIPLPAVPAPAPGATIDPDSLIERTRDYLRRECAEVLRLPSDMIDPQAALEKYGIDSLLAVKLTTQLERTFGSLSKTLFFEYQTLDDLSKYFIESHPGRLATLFAVPAHDDGRQKTVEPPIERLALPLPKRSSVRPPDRQRSAPVPPPESDPIAIIGLSGRYPEAFDIDAYWRNLRDGKDCITEVPKERWNWQSYFNDDRTKGGHHASKWGGFIAGVDEFDPLFFNISPKEAKSIDPQERLFLQHAWMAVEDAGYTRASLRVAYEHDLPGQVGVYVGVMYTEYQLFGAEASVRGQRMGIAASAASIANRVSYTLNLHGPSVTFDTMCSSSLTAIHFACLDLKLGRTSLAIAGGVNVTIHPNKYLVLSAGQFISSDGHCQSFGEGGDGYIPGEGVGVVVLKRLSEAERDGDRIYGVIRGSALNHGGKTNGYTVPNPQAQASAISRALLESGTDARHVSYIEAHGTGTKLGDPIEIAALCKAFQHSTRDTGFCLIGSAKSNIGHCESAAGIAGLTKVLLQMQHRQIVPSLHSARLNPHIDFASTPFIVNQALRSWEPPVIDGRTLPRIAGISSFGAGGSNAHLIVEEYQQPVREPVVLADAVIVLSARTAEQLRQKAMDLLDFVRSRLSTIDLAAMAYTLQVGREAMDERLGLTAGSPEQLVDKLQSWLAGRQGIEDLHHGDAKRNREALSVFGADADLQRTIDKWIAESKNSKLIELWVKGLDLDWRKLYGERTPSRIGLPTYPFARERYWVDVLTVAPVAADGAVSAALHPLLHSNTSDLDQQSYSSTFTGGEIFFEEAGGERVLPPAAYLEMARAAVQRASHAFQEATVELRHVVWTRPIATPRKEVGIALIPRGHDQIDFEIYSRDAGEEIVHCQGRAVSYQGPTPAALDLRQIERQSGQSDWSLVQLQLPDVADSTFAEYVLHPSLISGALQASAELVDGRPFALDSVRIVSACTKEMLACIRRATSAGIAMDVDLCDAEGNVCVQMRGLTFRAEAVDAGEVALDRAVLPTAPRREIALTPRERAVATPLGRRKTGAITLAAPGSPVSATPLATRAPITLSTPAAAVAVSPVRLYDDGNGVFSIQIATTSPEEAVVHLLQALARLQEEPSLKVALLSGLDCGVRYNEAVVQGLYSSIVSFPYPIIAALRSGASGAGFLAAALCDSMVCSEDASYAFANAHNGLYPTASVTKLFSERFGTVHAEDLLYRSATSTGAQLRLKGWTCPIVPAERVEPRTRELAAALATKSRDALRLLKQHLTRRLAVLAGELTPNDPLEGGDASGENVFVLELSAGSTRDLHRIFSEIQSGGYRAAVLFCAEDDALGAVPEELVLESEIPVIAALAGNARGNALRVAQLCDAAVYSREGLYSSFGIASTTASVFARRFGNATEREILLTGADYSGGDLEERVGALTVAERDEVLPTAMRMADSWSRLPRTVLTAWKRETATTLQKSLNDPPIGAESESSDAIPGPLPTAAMRIPLRSEVVTATVHPDGVVVVKMEDRGAKNMFSEALAEGIAEAFAHIAGAPQYKVVVLTGYDTYFASGGTKETLLTIQQGRAKFTDVKIYQAALDCKLPVIAALQGHGIGAGWAMGLFADVVLLSDESRYVSPYMDYGFTPGAGATYILPEALGHDLGTESLLTAQTYTGRELKERGLRLPVLPRAEVETTAMTLARQIARAPRGRSINLKEQWTSRVREALEETYRCEVAMHEQTFVGQSETLARIESRFHHEADAAVATTTRKISVDLPKTFAESDPLPVVTAGLKALLANELQMRESDIDENAQFVDLGLDSISGVTWIRKINDRYRTSIEATKVYSYPTLAQLARYVRDEAETQGTLEPRTAAAALFTPAIPPRNEIADSFPAENLTSWRTQMASRFASGAVEAPRSKAIAIVGIAGQFPQANNLEEFWRNIAEGRNCITTVARDRWDVNTYYQPGEPAPGKTNSQWLGALEEYDRFDPLFFNISPTEAETMDPQQRLFLQACWHAIENAGYDPRSLSASRCGVFAGCAFGDYHLLSREQQLSGQSFTGDATSVLAARVSYFLNLHGPCLSIDTACSSSLVAIANACDSLTTGGSDLALAGGVYVMAGPELHVRTSQVGMLSPDGQCFAFDQRANGIVPGEGVGVVMLKRLADAQRDGDLVYGVIEGWGVNQDGKTNGITAPNPESQARLEQEVYDRYRIDPAHIQLIEAHGTGTKLGDPIEVEGLKAAFSKYTDKKAYCALGSVKSNIGHCLTAAGIAGLIKLLLALKHRRLPPTINFDRLNEHIDLSDSPFYVNARLEEWELRGAPRRHAAISAFGFGGTNAHLVIGEYLPPQVGRAVVASPLSVVPLSARTPEQLRQKARDLSTFLRSTPSADLAEIAYTLQAGRTAMDERVGFVASSVEDLTRKIDAYLDGTRPISGVHQGRVVRNDESLSIISQDDDIRKTILDKWIADRNLAKLLELWVRGLEVDWSRLYGETRPRRIALPVYPFAKERYWIDTAARAQTSMLAASVLHPLLHVNTSDLSRQSYRTTFRGDEFFLRDHQVREGHGTAHKVLPGVAYLEMARAAIEHALPERPESTILELRNTVWVQPIVIDDTKQVGIALTASDYDEIDFEIYSGDGADAIVHCQGRGVLIPQPPAASVDLDLSRGADDRELEPAGIYTAFARMGLLYGPAFQGIAAVQRRADRVLAQLRLPEIVESTAAEYVLHPSLMDSALQACVGLLEGIDAATRPRLPFALDSLRVVAPCTSAMFASVRYSPGSQAGDQVVKLDIELCDERGDIAVQMRGFSLRTLTADLKPAAAERGAIGRLFATPAWHSDDLATPAERGGGELSQYHVILCELPEIDVARLESLLPHSHCLPLYAHGLTIAHRYSEYARACFERVQAVLETRDRTLVQVVVVDHEEQALFGGLSALLKTAALENPTFAGQVILVRPGITAEELAGRLRDERSGAIDAVVRYGSLGRQILKWKEVEYDQADPPLALRDDGVYLITGGLGALGRLFAREIAGRTRHATIFLTGRSELTIEKQAIVDGLSMQTGRARYRKVDLADLDQVRQLVAAIRDDCGRLDGILHCAGTTADNFVARKTSDELGRILEPKVIGTFHLDEASRDLALDFFVLFSSIAGAIGNVGQSDYAAANAFMDQFAAHRNRQVSANQRHGRTRSINWSLWQAGGMHPDPVTLEFVQQATGIRPMQTSSGLDAFYRSLALPFDQILVAEGDLARMRRAILAGGVSAVRPESKAREAVLSATSDPADLFARTEEYLRKQLSGLLKLQSRNIDPEAPLETYGIDSILALKLTNRLEETFGSLSKTLFFEYQTIRALTQYFVESHAARLSTLFASAVQIHAPSQTEAPLPAKRAASQRPVRLRSAAPRPTVESDPIAIIGLSGRYPEAIDVDAYWKNLRDGRDCITEIPRQRWDWQAYFSEDRTTAGNHFSKWGGFIAGVDEFDALFFNISPKEAKTIDPQERLFLQHAWMAVEDAGYTRASLQMPHAQDLPGQVGVYVGVMYSEYQLFGADSSVRGKRMGIPGSMASIANRVSYALNLHGPSMTLDTMCSSSLTAIHLACQDLKLGRTSLAIAGGVNVSIHPNKYLVLSAGQFISSDGHCQSFGEGGDGYIPGEGVGAVVLKRLSEATRDGDHIYGVIRGSALNHGGKTNGYSVPNPQAQSSAISRALAESGVDARHIGYIEAHGTGTKLGDPIEIAALSKAFQHYTQDRGFCLIGSAKSNIGHCESAAGIAGLTKVLLQMQNQEIVPSLHSAQLNPHIEFAKTPFIVNQTLRSWEPPVIDGRALPRIAGISSFGAGGSNAHIIVEEYQPPVQRRLSFPQFAVPLSARTFGQLQRKAQDLLAFLEPRVSTIDPAALAYTLQTGREAMDERIGFVVASVDELVEKLRDFVAGERDIEGAYRGEVKRDKQSLSLFSTDSDLQQTIDKWIGGWKLAKLMELWVKGLELDWGRLYGENRPQRVSLPAYPFARERHWIEIDAGDTETAKAVASTAVLHPLLHSNISDLTEQRYRSTFSGGEIFFAGGQLSPMACLEMARAAIEHASRTRPEAAMLELLDAEWVQPVVGQSRQIDIAVFPGGDDEIEYEIYSQDGDEEVVHCRGRASFNHRKAPPALALDQLRGSGQLLAQLRLPDAIENTLGDYVLHPVMMDSALRACAGLAEGGPVVLETLRIFAPCVEEMFAWIRSRQDVGAKIDIDLCDAQGKIIAQVQGLILQPAPVHTVRIGEQTVVRDAMSAIPVAQEKIAIATRPRKEIELVPRQQILPVLADRRKPAAISLTVPGAATPAPAAASAIRSPIILSSASARSLTPSVRLYEEGNGVFSIQTAGASTDDFVVQLRSALDRARVEASLKVLRLDGLGWGLDSREVIAQGLCQSIASFPYPVIAVVERDAVGADFLIAALCDFMVCNEDASYGYTDMTPAMAGLLSERFGAAQSQEVLRGLTAAGRQLRVNGWTSPILPAPSVHTYAAELASALAMKSQEALRLLKQHLTRRVAAMVTALVTALAPAVASAVPHHENVLVIDLARTGTHDLRRMLADAQYGAVVLVSEEDDGLGAVPQDVILECEVPIVAALAGNARGDAWRLAQLCDACVYNETAVYSAVNVIETAAELFATRLGNEAAREILLTGAEYSGSDLRRRVGALTVVESDQVRSTAIKIASAVARLPQAKKLCSPPFVTEQSEEAPEPPTATTTSIRHQSDVVTATEHPGGIVVVKMEDREAKNLFSEPLVNGLTEVFAQIERTPTCKVVVLTGYEQYFAMGGTKESLLSIQAGTARFTDSRVFRLPLDCKLPVIAAMQGHGVGAGWCLGMFADLVLLSEESRYVSPYMDYGFTPGAGATWVLPDRIGQDLSRESLLTARAYTGRELRERGLRLPILPRGEVNEAAMALARRIAQFPRHRLIGLKRQLTAYAHAPLDEAIRHELAMHEKTFVGQSETLARIETRFGEDRSSRPRTESVAARSAVDSLPTVAATLKKLLATELLMQESDIDDNAQFVDLGLDSISGVSWIRRINETYRTSIEATKVYSYPTLAKLSQYVRTEAEQQGALSTAVDAAADESPVMAEPVMPAAERRAVEDGAGEKRLRRRGRTAARFTAGTTAAVPLQAIAVVGIAGQFPQAGNVDEFWRNIAEGRNCITPVPSQRWDLSAYYQPGQAVPGKTNSQWFGALADYDRFDPLFFNISPTEAENMDPQQRLFLQACWHSIENAGYDAHRLAGSKCGVFIGCAIGDYHQLSRPHQLSAHGFTGNATSILAARISYFLDLRGPCVSIDTACSSSLVAIAQACDSLISGASDLALAGGVYVMSGPEMHIRTAQAGMLSPDGRCFTFDQRANGFVPGEGVGVVVLKRLADAERDGDLIHGVIQGWGVNQDGRTNGITAPNPESQTRLEQDVYEKFNIDPANIQLVEAHGTGTKLGDPIEVEGLKASFGRFTQKKQYCALGSVKSNIGHCLTAAGIAGVLKLLLALKHRQLPPTINFESLNEHIELTESPFYVNTRLQEWQVDGAAARQSAISSFGFSGTNAHLVIGEYLPPVDVERPAPAAPRSEVSMIPLSARTADQLRQKAQDLLDFIRENRSADLADVAYTLQVGRAAMDERLAFIAGSVAQLTEKLDSWLNGRKGIEGIYQGQAKRNKEALSLFTADGDLRQTIESWIADRKLSKVLDLWVKGLELDWNRLYGQLKPRRISLPPYPFAKERYWIETTAREQKVAAQSAILHPLLHSNTSDLSGQRYRTTFTGDEPFLDRQRGHEKLPAMAYLEMARAAIEHASTERPRSAMLELRDVLWAQPVVVGKNTHLDIALSPDGDEQIDFEIYSDVAGQPIVHCQGRAVWSRETEPLRGSGQVLTRLELSPASNFVLPLNLMERLLQAAGLSDASAASLSLKVLRIASRCAGEIVARYSRVADGVDIDLCDDRGNVCVEMRGLSSRAVAPSETIGQLLAAPVWQASDAVGSADTRKLDLAERHLVLCELPAVDPEALRSLAPHIQCLTLHADGQRTIAERYSEHALACFERIQNILKGDPQGKVLIQIAIPDDEEGSLLAGLSSLLNTAALENPRIAGQVVLVPAQTTVEELAGRLQAEQPRTFETLIRYEPGKRDVRRWEAVQIDQEKPPVAFRDDGVYLITGGLGALGLLFAEEILTQTTGARVVLTGRSELNAEKQDRMSALSAHADRSSYRHVDLGDLDQVSRLVEDIRGEYGRLNGILHCAGMLVENLIPQKSTTEFKEVLGPKVAGTFNLDLASQGVRLDFFVLFSSIAGAMGNPRTADYAVANAFLDHFAAYRNRQVAGGRRYGLTRSINWPVWRDGGMGTDPASQERLQRTTGMLPMQRTTGMQAFHRSLSLPYDELLVVEGIQPQITSYYLQRAPSRTEAVPARMPRKTQVGIEQLQQGLKAILATVLRMDASTIDADQAFVEFGLDSFLGIELVNAINKEYGTELSSITVFDYPTVRELARLLEQEIERSPGRVDQEGLDIAAIRPLPAAGSGVMLEKKTRSRKATRGQERHSGGKIAIIGMSGRYPQARNRQEYWDNLVNGRNAIAEVPPSRWDVHRYYDPDPGRRGKATSKWLGALDDIDCFDPLFFRISPQEADYIDPHHRLFLEESYKAFEDAGYSSHTLSNAKCGVYLGIAASEYPLLLAKNSALGDSPVTSNHTAIAAARIAYYLNLKGPAISVDTACSSSLVAIHLACQGLLSGETDMALAGGVTLWLTPESYLSMTQAGMLSMTGQCKAFDDSADGIVVSDGVGALVLKRLEDAEADRDFIYGVILGSGINQDGRTNGITAPSVNSQIELERSVYAKCGIDPESISYVEAHGTGTKLGDPIELEALATVFKEKTSRKNFCAVGSVKSNIGHPVSAAGVASVQKVLLSLRHRTLVPTLHVTKENAHFDFESSPFYISRETRPWEAPAGSLRRAAVSSFGFSGTNAHLVIEEYPSQVGECPPVGEDAPFIVPLSARTPAQLRQKARDLYEYLRTAQEPMDLQAVAYTLQIGREAMEERVGFIVSSIDQLTQKLEVYIGGETNVEGIHQGRVEPGGDGMMIIDRDEDMQEAIDKWISRRKVSKLLELWIRGLHFDWNRLHGEVTPRRVPLPAYPFARERYWIDSLPLGERRDSGLLLDADMKSIEDILNEIDNDTMDAEQGVQALKMLV